MPIMPPGYTTGIYYIPVGNLPWNCTWKKLKDHARNRQPDGSGLAILEANVYPGSTSTSGWVSVQGLPDFRSALHHLNHSPMEDPPRAARTLQADGRNETKPVMLGESLSASPSPSRRCAQQQNAWHPVSQHTNIPLPQEFYPNLWAFQPTTPVAPTPMSPSISESSYYQPPSPHYDHTQSFNGFAPQAEYRQAVQPGMVLVPMAPMHQPLYVVPVEPQMSPVPQAPSPHHSQMISLPQATSPRPVPVLDPAPRVIKTEARKIIITGVPITCSEKDLQELINSVSSTQSRSPRSRHRNSPEGTRYYLQHLEIAKHSNGTPKGHAFAVLESHSTAKCTVDALNGLSWQGRTLHARFAKEGVESNNHSLKATQPSQVSQSRSRNGPRNAKGKVRERHVPRSMVPEDQYLHNGEAKVMDVDEYLSAQFANIQIDYRGDTSCSSSQLEKARTDQMTHEVSSLSKEGEQERRRKTLSDDGGSHTPVVVDGSSCGGRKYKSI